MNARHSVKELWGIYKEELHMHPIPREVSTRKKFLSLIEDNYVRAESDKCHQTGNKK